MKQRWVSWVLMATLSVGVWAKSAPVVTLERLTSNIISHLTSYKAGQLTKPKLLKDIKQEVVVYLDQNTMAKQVVGRHAWRQADPKTRQAFIREFIDMVLAAYAHVLADFDDQTIQFNEPRDQQAKRYVRVQSWIVALNGQKTEVVYHMRKRGDDWKIFDIGIEGVSLVNSYHAQFLDVLNKDGLNGLVVVLQRQAKGRA